MVHMQRAIAGLVTFATGIVQAFQHSGNGLEVFEAYKLMLFDFVPFFTHERHLNIREHRAQV